MLRKYSQFRLFVVFLLWNVVACGGPTPKIELLLSTQDVTQGSLKISFALSGVDGVEKAALYVDGDLVAQLKSIDEDVYLSVTNLTNGEHKLKVKVKTAGGVSASDVSDFTVTNPNVWVTAFEAPEIVYPGGNIRIRLTTDRPASKVEADLSLLNPDGGEASITQTTDGLNWYISQSVVESDSASEGWYNVPIRVFDSEDRRLLFRDVRIFRGSGPLMPLRSDVGVLEYGSFPAGGNQGASLNAVGVSADTSVISGGQFNIGVNYSGADPRAQALIGVDGYGGYLVVSLAVAKALAQKGGFASMLAPFVGSRLRPGFTAPQQANQPGQVNLSVYLPDGSLPDNARELWNVNVALRDSQGRIGDILTVPVNVAEAKRGELRVTLSWDTATDVDLHVVEPGGSEIYYSNRTSANGGQLDLDSNAGCSIDGVNQENIYWERPVNGEYIVRVDFWSDCPDDEGNGLPASWRVVATGCGIEQEASGFFSAGEADGGSAGSGVEALRFTAECEPYKVSGIATYAKNSPMAQATMIRSMEGIAVKVVDVDGKVLGESRVGPDGEYSVLFDPPADGSDAEVHLLFEAGDDSVRAEQLDGSGVHVYEDNQEQASIWKPSEEPDYRRDVFITDSNFTGAINIYQQGKKAIRWYAAKGYIVPGALVIQWTDGQAPNCGSCFYPDSDIIKLTGTAADPDQFDDPVILHEIGHRMHERIGRVDSPGGAHSITQRVTPALAYSEGLVTYLGQRVHGDVVYFDSFANGVAQRRIDTMYASIPTGTSNNKSWGRLSEGVVMAAMWDMYDPVNAGEHDGVTGWDDTLLHVAFNSSLTDDDVDFGIKNKVDFADLIGLMLCDIEAAAKSVFDTLLTGKYNLPWLKEDKFCTP